jgi:hypothetical protein
MASNHLPERTWETYAVLPETEHYPESTKLMSSTFIENDRKGGMRTFA